MAKSGSLKSTLAVSLNNYLDAGAIVAGASGVTLWQNYLGLSEMHLGWLNALSANALGAAIGAIIGGFLADKFGRKFIFTYNLLVYMTGVLITRFFWQCRYILLFLVVFPQKLPPKTKCTLMLFRIQSEQGDLAHRTSSD